MAPPNNGTEETEPILQTRDLTRSVFDGGSDRTIVAGVTFDFCSCRVYTIVGPSGAGKSSLLRLLNRLDEPTGGTIRFHSKDTREYSPCQLRQRIGYLFQTPHLFPSTTADNLRFARPGLSVEDMRHLLGQVRLPEALLERDVDSLSIGERQRAALARLLATDPDVILLDEPTSALDPGHTESIEQLIREIVGQCRITAIMVTHNPQQALRMDGQTLLVVDGRLVESGPSEQVIEHPQSEAGRAYREKRLT